MADQNVTIFQKLTSMFGFPGQIKSEEKTPNFNFSRDELLKTGSKEEFEKNLLQANGLN